MLQLAAQVSDHYLHTGGELSSSSFRIHPGERQTREAGSSSATTGCRPGTEVGVTDSRRLVRSDATIHEVAACWASQ